MYRTISLVLPVAHDDVYDYVVAGASGPDRIVLVLSARQWEYRLSAQKGVGEIWVAPTTYEGVSRRTGSTSSWWDGLASTG